MALTTPIREIGLHMSQHEYSVGLATARTEEELKQLAKEYLEKKAQQEKEAKDDNATARRN